VAKAAKVISLEAETLNTVVVVALEVLLGLAQTGAVQCMVPEVVVVVREGQPVALGIPAELAESVTPMLLAVEVQAALQVAPALRARQAGPERQQCLCAALAAAVAGPRRLPVLERREAKAALVVVPVVAAEAEAAESLERAEPGEQVQAENAR
jgi:hypothetical protein